MKNIFKISFALLLTFQCNVLFAQRPEGRFLKLDGNGDFFQLSQHAAELIFDAPVTIEFWLRANFEGVL